MKQTSDKLEFQEMFAFWLGLLVGGFFLASGLFLGWSSGNFFLYLFALVGLLLVIFVEIDTITFDKNLGQMTIKRHKPLIAKTKLIEHLLQDISGVEIEKMTSRDRSMYGARNTYRVRHTYRVCLVLNAGKRRLPLTSSFSTGLGNKQKKAEVIATFLNIRNYGIEGFPRENSNELKWDSIE